MAARRRAAGLAADALFTADDGDQDAQPAPPETDAAEEEEAERRYQLELSRELQARCCLTDMFPLQSHAHICLFYLRPVMKWISTHNC